MKPKLISGDGRRNMFCLPSLPIPLMSAVRMVTNRLDPIMPVRNVHTIHIFISTVLPTGAKFGPNQNTISSSETAHFFRRPKNTACEFRVSKTNVKFRKETAPNTEQLWNQNIEQKKMEMKMKLVEALHQMES